MALVPVEGAVWGLWGNPGVSLVQCGQEDARIAKKGGERLYRLVAASQPPAAQPESAQPDLAARIMNIPADGATLDWANTREAYLYGHRDARHAAAALAAAQPVPATGAQPLRGMSDAR